MSMTRFVSNDDLWKEIDARVGHAHHVRAAVAYFGKGGAAYLRLRRRDKLVVDMSFRAVKQGVTDPREIRKLIRRGVEVFTRPSLHAKFFIIDRALIAGSANVSRNARKVLDEAAILTTDPMAVRRALAFFDDKLTTQPVRDRYLRACIKAYRPPRFKAALESTAKNRKEGQRAVEASLWFVGGLAYINPTEPERNRIEIAEHRAERKLKRPDKTRVDSIRYGRRPQYFDKIRAGDWVIHCIRDTDGTRDVWAPEQVISEDHYPRDGRKRGHLLMLERPANSEAMPLSQFRRSIGRLIVALDRPSPRTRPIVDTAWADAVFALWTPAGRVSRKRKRG